MRVAVAAWLANAKKLGFDDPCWLSIIAPASTAKTVIVTALADATGGYLLDTLTPQTWISGLHLGKQGKSRQRGLLHQLGARPNVFIKDLSAFLTKRRNDREELIGQLRTIYDGEFCRATGTGGGDREARWKGRMTLITGMTPIVDIYHTLNNQLGERFIQLRFEIAEDDVVAVAAQALKNAEEGANPRKELAVAVKQAITKATPLLSRSVLGKRTKKRLENLVAFVTKARTGVVRRGDNVEIAPKPEGPGRLIKQLSALACGLAALRGTTYLTEADYRLVERVAFDSIPEPRGEILWELYERGAHTVSDVAKRVKVSRPTIQKHLNDLLLLGLAQANEVVSGQERDYHPSELGLQYLGGARGREKKTT
jgi:DNA-binding transcriptional ArsR family regulator